jgi:hypothetical protein
VRGAKVLLVVVAAVVLAGCGETVDTAKQTYTRTTVPAGQGGDETGTSTGKPKTNDPAFSNDELRKLDPCALLSEDILASVGTPDDNHMGDFGECANYMVDKDGKELSLTLLVGETISGAEGADGNIGGLPAFENELDDSTACFVNAITSTNPNFGIRVQVGGEGKDLCKVGTTVLTGAVDIIRADPPQRAAKRGSVAESDPCTLLDESGLKTALGVETSVSPYSLHWCNWIGDDVSAGLWFRTGYDPKDSTVNPGSPVDLGSGITGYQTSTASGNAASCRIAWRHRSTGEDGADEIVEVNVDNSNAPAGADSCATAAAVAKLLIPALPKP